MSGESRQLQVAPLISHRYPLSAIAESAVPCDLQHGPCNMEAKGISITFDIQPKPVKVMFELQFIVLVAVKKHPLTDASITLDLSMPGMYMGENRVRLAPLGPGAWRGRGVVVRCPSGRRTWSAEVTLRHREPATAAPLVATFTFDVGD